MRDPSRAVRVVSFGPYEADFAGAELRKNGIRIKLQDRPFDILQILLQRPGEVITREEFRKRLWPADTFVDFDHSLNASINKLRQALNDDADSPRFVATVGRRGYKFIATVEKKPFRPEQTDSPVNVPASAGPRSPTAVGPRIRLKDWGLRALGLALAMAVILAIWAWAVGRLPESLHRRAREVAGEGTNPSAGVKPRRSFAVLGLKNLSGKRDEAWLSTALSEMLATELAAGENRTV